MIDHSVRWLSEQPQLHQPTMIVMLSGWIDASGAADASMSAIHDESDASLIAVFDDDTYIDYRARRPTMELRDGLNTVLEWERISLSVGRDQAGHDLVLLSGPEPDMAWHRFCDTVGDLAVDLGVRMCVGLGAYPFATPHTRSPRLSVSTPSADILATVPFLRSSVDVPAGTAAAIEHAMHDRGIPALGIWVQVPHYATQLAYPAASAALLDGLRTAADVVIDGASLRTEAIAHREKLDAMVAENDEHVRMLHQLEELHDATDDVHDPESSPSDGPTLEMRSGDELAAEFQKFLRDQP